MAVKNVPAATISSVRGYVYATKGIQATASDGSFIVQRSSTDTDAEVRVWLKCAQPNRMLTFSTAIETRQNLVTGTKGRYIP